MPPTDVVMSMSVCFLRNVMIRMFECELQCLCIAWPESSEASRSLRISKFCSIVLSVFVIEEVIHLIDQYSHRERCMEEILKDRQTENQITEIGMDRWRMRELTEEMILLIL